MNKKYKKIISDSRLYIEYKENVSGGDPEDPSDKWTTFTDTLVDVCFIKSYRNQPTHIMFYDSIEVEEYLLQKDTLYLAVVRYSDADSFSFTSGKWYIAGVSDTYKGAEMLLSNEIKPSPSDKKSDGTRKFPYKPWEGYFERLEGTEIHKVEVI